MKLIKSRVIAGLVTAGLLIAVSVASPTWAVETVTDVSVRSTVVGTSHGKLLKLVDREEGVVCYAPLRAGNAEPSYSVTTHFSCVKLDKKK